MSIPNLNNWFNFLTGRRTKELKDTDILPIGRPDSRSFNGWSPASIRYGDLKKAFGSSGAGLAPEALAERLAARDGSVCDIAMTSSFGPLQNLTVPGVGTQTGADLGPAVVIPGVLELSRNDSGGAWFNSVSESVYAISSPADTEWNSVYVDPFLNGFDNLSLANLAARTYDNFFKACDQQIGNVVVGLELICHVISTDQYFKVNVTNWDSGGGLGPYGGFAVEFTEIVADPCVVTFSDGTKMSTVPTDTNANSWGMDSVAFVSPTANPGTGAIGFANTQPELDTPNTAFRTVAEANASGATKIFLLPGNYSGIIGLDSKYYYCYPGVVFGSGSRLRDNGVVDAKVMGEAVFGPFSYGIEFLNASTLYIECDEFDNSRGVAFARNGGGNIHLKCNKVFCNGFNGAAFCCYPQNGATIRVDCNEWTSYYWVSTNVDSTFIFRCPDVKIISGGNYGNVAKSLFTVPGSILVSAVMDFDFLGGTYHNQMPTQPVTFGVFDSALGSLTNAAVTDDVKIKVSNGFVLSDAIFGINLEYNIHNGFAEYNNLQIKTPTTNPVRTFQRATAAPGQLELVFKNCDFEGHECILGNGRKITAIDCNFKNTEAGGLSNFDYNNQNPTTPGEGYFINCNFQLVNTGGETFKNFGLTPAVLGCAKTISSEVIGVGATDTYGDFTTIPTLELPNIEL